MRTSVCSVDGDPSAGSDWTKSVAGVARVQMASSSRPSIATDSPSSMRTAVIERRIGSVSVVCAEAREGEEKKTALTASRTRRLLEQVLGDRLELQVGRAFVDLTDLGIAIQFFHRIVAHEAVASVQIDGSRGHTLGDLG